MAEETEETSSWVLVSLGSVINTTFDLAFVNTPSLRPIDKFPSVRNRLVFTMVRRRERLQKPVHR